MCRTVALLTEPAAFHSCGAKLPLLAQSGRKSTTYLPGLTLSRNWPVLEVRTTGPNRNLLCGDVARTQILASGRPALVVTRPEMCAIFLALAGAWTAGPETSPRIALSMRCAGLGCGLVAAGRRNR